MKEIFTMLFCCSFLLIVFSGFRGKLLPKSLGLSSVFVLIFSVLILSKITDDEKKIVKIKAAAQDEIILTTWPLHSPCDTTVNVDEIKVYDTVKVNQ